MNLLNIYISSFDLLIYFENAAQWHTVYLRKNGLNGPWPIDRMKTHLMRGLYLPSSLIEHSPFGTMIFPAKPPCIKKYPAVVWGFCSMIYLLNIVIWINLIHWCLIGIGWYRYLGYPHQIPSNTHNGWHHHEISWHYPLVSPLALPSPTLR